MSLRQERVCIEAKQSTGLSGGVKCDTGTTAPPPPQVSKVSVSGLTVTLSFYNFSGAGTWNVRCWNAPTWEQRKWPVISGGVATSAGNYLGEPGSRAIPSTGSITFTCPGNQYDPTMRPNANFSIEFQGAVPNWYHIGP